MLLGLHSISKGTLLPVLICACTVSLPAQVNSEQFHKLLTTAAAFEQADIAALKNGETVIKILPLKDKRQIALCGAVRVRSTRDISMETFRESLTQKDNKSRLSSGEFHIPPEIGDIQSLKLRDEDIEDLKKCEVGRCDIKLSAALIKRIRTEVDWEAPDHAAQAERLYKQVLVDYVDGYLKRGDAALMRYDSRKVAVALADEYRNALDNSLFINEFAPEFVRYLRDFPLSGLPEMENNISWSNVTFGLDPVLAITHSINYSGGSGGNSLHLVGAKQIYSSRYLDSSLAFTMLVTVRGANGAETYLIFTDLSRSNVLDGPFSGLKRGLVETEAKDRIGDMLAGAKMRLEANLTNRAESPVESEETGFAARIWKLGRHRVVRLFLLFLLGGIAFALYREWRNAKAAGRP